jgi:hypothetical protein
MAVNAIVKFLNAARSLVNQGMSKEAIMQFAKNEFGEINELFQKQIDNLFKQKQGIENIKIKDEVFDDTIIKLPIDDTGAPFNPKDPMKQYGKPKKSKKMTDVEEAIDNASPGFADDRKYDAQLVADDLAEKRFGKEFYDLDEIDQMELYDEAYQGLSKQRFKQRQDFEKQFNKDVEEAGGMEAFLNANPISEKPTFRLNKERFKKDFNVTDEEVEKISLLSPEDQQKKVREYIDKDFKERIELSDYDVTDLEPNAEGGIVGYYTGGLVDVEPSLSDIGHGSDALMARTRLMSPGSQATTSTGLNYLLAEDNDNIRVPFADGNGVADEDAEKAALGKRVRELMDDGFDFGEAVKKAMSEGYAEGGRIGFSKGKIAKEVLDKGRRGFMKAAGAAGAGIAALKTGLLGFGEKAAPVVEKVAETVSETAKGVPPYFFKLVDKIKTMGDDVTEKMATQERQKVTRYKDFELTEDVATGEQTIQRIKIDDGNPQYYDETLAEETYMNYKPGAGQSDEAGRVADEYTEDTSYIRTSGPQKGEIFDTVDGVPDDVIEEGTMFEDNMTEFGKTKKASGGIARMIGE